MVPGGKGRGLVGVTVLGTLVLFNACGMDKVTIPEIDGPSELGLSVELRVTPDVITADGFSTALVQGIVRDQTGNPASGRTLLFALADSAGNFADIGTLYDTSGSLRLHAGTATATSGSNGIAQVIYQAPARTDATANQLVTVAVRPVGTDANAASYRSVKIELKSAEPRLFPEAGSEPPTCGFVVEVPAGAGSCTGAGATTACTVKPNTTILFQTTSFDEDGFIVRYEWFFADGTQVNYAPDTAHVFKFSGTFDVSHRVTDNSGAQSACFATLTVE